MKFTKNKDFKPPISKKEQNTKMCSGWTRESWGRLRQVLEWTTGDLDKIKIKHMSTPHIKKCIRKISNWGDDQIWGSLTTTNWHNIFKAELNFRGIYEI